MKYITILLIFSFFGAALLAQKTQYPAAPQVVAEEEPPETTWTEKPIVITNQDLRHHAEILTVSRAEETSELTNSDQEEREDSIKTRPIQESELHTFPLVLAPNVEIPDRRLRIRQGHLKELLQRLFKDGKSSDRPQIHRFHKGVR